MVDSNRQIMVLYSYVWCCKCKKWFVKFLFNIKIPVPEKDNLKLLNVLKKSNHSNEEKV